MHLALAALAEQLAHDFRELQCSAVVRVLTDCADECRFGCIGWLHRFDAAPEDTTSTVEQASGDDHLLDL